LVEYTTEEGLNRLNQEAVSDDSTVWRDSKGWKQTIATLIPAKAELALRLMKSNKH